MSELWLVRHGESLANINHEVTGSLHSPLTENGRSQARNLGSFLRNKLQLTPTKLITSSMTRAIETSELLDYSLPILKLPDLNETDAGKVATWRRKDFDEKFSDFWTPFDPHRKFPGGESHMDLYRRVTDCTQDILTRAAPDDKILIVAHQGTVSAIMHHYYNVPMNNFSRFTTSNGSVSVLKFQNLKPQPQLLYFNLRPL